MDEKLVLRRFDDMHCHLRTKEILQTVLPQTIKYASRAVVMPNIRPRAVLTADDVRAYRQEIKNALQDTSEKTPFQPLMTAEIRDDTTPDMIEKIFFAGAMAGKVYPLGTTTNSDQGLRDFEGRVVSETFQAMQDMGMPLCIHGEVDDQGSLVTEREKDFILTFLNLVDRYPKLKVVFEHTSTREAITAVSLAPDNVVGTITAHHLCLTLNDVIGNGIQPHNMCMPVPKTYNDRKAIIEAATNGDRKFFLGSDSAPHPRDKKEGLRGACGIYSAPVLPQVLTEVFEKAGALDKLEDFTSRFGAEFYGLPPNEGTITLEKKDWVVPGQIGGIVPFRAGQTLSWQLV